MLIKLLLHELGMVLKMLPVIEAGGEHKYNIKYIQVNKICIYIYIYKYK